MKTGSLESSLKYSGKGSVSSKRYNRNPRKNVSVCLSRKTQNAEYNITVPHIIL